MAEESLILDKKQLLQKIKRIAFEIYEQNYKEKEIILAGIEANGYIFGQLLKEELSSISPIKITLIKVSLDKLAKVQTEVKLDTQTESLTNKVIIVIDDVLNTGRTLAYSLKPFLIIETAKIQTAVIVDRNHQDYPIAADYVGYSLSTTIREHIEVSFDESRFGVYIK